MTMTMTTPAPRRRSRLAALITMTVLSLLGTAVAVQAFNPQPEPPARWVVGLTFDQTASLTAVNLAQAGECVVGWSWLDENGVTLARNEMHIEPGAFAVDLFHPPEPVRPDDGAETPARFSVRGAVTPLTPRCELATTLEVFNNADGKTTFAIGNARQ